MKNNTVLISWAALTTCATLAIAQSPDLLLAQADSAVGSTDAAADSLMNARMDEQRARVGEQKRRAEEAVRAQNAFAVAQTKSGDRLAAVVHRTDGAGRALVIPKDATDAKSLAEIEEDLNVMAHILDKAAKSDEQAARAMGIAVFSQIYHGGNAPQNLYIEGHGAIFFLNVNFPLIAPPTKESDSTAREKTNTEWEEARREMAGPAAVYGGTLGSLNPGGPLFVGAGPAEYDASKVETLKKSLIAGLKNSGHIRKLKPDETVTVVVNAPGAAEPKAKRKTAAEPVERDSDFQLAKNHFDLWLGERSAPSGASAQLMLRVRKSDAEAFENGKLSFEEFRKKVTLILY